MTYNEFIQNIIDQRGQWNIPEGEYYEPHHIVPKCLGGLPLNYRKNEKRYHPNIIWLTAKEHFEAHRLLYLENQDDKKLVWVFMVMCNKHPEFYTAEDYEQARLKLSQIMINKKWTLESRKKLSNSCKGKFIGEKNGMYGKRGPLNHLYGKKLPRERVEKAASKHKGQKWSEESKQKLRDLAKIIPNYGNRGGTISEKQKQIIKEKCSKKVICLETNKIYNSLEEASQEFNCSKALICLVCKGKRKSAKNFHFKYYQKGGNEQ